MSLHQAGVSWFSLDYRDLISVPRDAAEIQSVAPHAPTVKVFRHQSRILKLAFFAFREGPRATLLKILAARFYSRIASQAVVVTLRDRRTGRVYRGLQHSINQPVYYFHPSLSEAADSSPAINPFLGWSPHLPPDARERQFASFELPENKGQPSDTELCVVGCGDYVRTYVLPAFNGFEKTLAVDFNWEVLTRPPFNGFRYRTNDFHSGLERLPSTSRSRVALIASYHSYHADQAIAFLKNPRTSVILEKPPCVSQDQLARLAQVYDPDRVLLGYNRRYIPWNGLVRDLVRDVGEPVVMTFHITEVQITPAHWYFAPNQGSRICGNLCHWVDLAVFILGQHPTSVAVARNHVRGIDYSGFSLGFADGSIAHFVANDLGDGTRGVQERISVKSESLDISINDYLSMRIWVRGRSRTRLALFRDKGHQRMYRAFRRFLSGDSKAVQTHSRDEFVSITAAYLAMVDLFYSSESERALNGGRVPAPKPQHLP